MSTNWVELSKSIAPVAAATVAVFGVWIGAGLTRRASLQTFTRELIFKEMDRRRQLGVEYKKAAWGLGARVGTLRGLVHQVAKAQATVKEANATFNFPETRERIEKLRDAFAELESFSQTNVQVPARACMEALTKCFNACVNREVVEADAQWAVYSKQWETLVIELNKDAEHFNSVIYASLTPVWRAILRRSTGKPPPFVPMEHPTEAKHAGERLNLKPILEKELQIKPAATE